MARRKENEFFELFRELFMTVPAWMCIPVAVIAFVLINGIIIGFANSSPIAKGFAGVAPMFAGFAAQLKTRLAGWQNVATFRGYALLSRNQPHNSFVLCFHNRSIRVNVG